MKAFKSADTFTSEPYGSLRIMQRQVQNQLPWCHLSQPDSSKDQATFYDINNAVSLHILALYVFWAADFEWSRLAVLGTSHDNRMLVA